MVYLWKLEHQYDIFQKLSNVYISVFDREIWLFFQIVIEEKIG